MNILLHKTTCRVLGMPVHCSAEVREVLLAAWWDKLFRPSLSLCLHCFHCLHQPSCHFLRLDPGTPGQVQPLKNPESVSCIMVEKLEVSFFCLHQFHPFSESTKFFSLIFQHKLFSRGSPKSLPACSSPISRLRFI